MDIYLTYLGFYTLEITMYQSQPVFKPHPFLFFKPQKSQKEDIFK